MKQYIFILFIISLYSLNLFSQSLINTKVQNVDLKSDSVFLDKVLILPSSIKFYDSTGNELKGINYDFDILNSLLVIDRTNLSISTLNVEYKYSVLNINKPISLLDTSALLKHEVSKRLRFDISDVSNNYDKQNFGTELSRKGSLMRGFSFGNNQDLVMNSLLNLQLDGKLQDNIFITAAISDNNIPIQPDGSSYQLQDIDKVFIKIYNKNYYLIAGDFEHKQQSGYFLKYNKKSQGFIAGQSIDIENKKSNHYKLNNSISGSIAKGKYKRQDIRGIEGNQGPYKLIGNNNERYIIVLSGSERVYIDGKLMKRGNDFDYIIDYNQAEIIFTAQQVITKDKRIIIEFEYSDRTYTRYLICLSNTLELSKSKHWFNIFHESDNKNKNFDHNLSLEDKKKLNSIGDNIGTAFIPSFDSLSFNSNEVRYRLCDTIVGAITYDSIFVYSTDPNNAYYRVSFAYIGENKGTYKRSVSTYANGRVFEWVAPIDGQLQGDYVPYRQLVAPQKTQLANFGGEINIGSSTQLNYEIAYSINDKNTFSKLDTYDDHSGAIKTGIKHYFINNSKNKFFLTSDYEFSHKYFNYIEDYRSPEFSRDWNLKSSVLGKNQNIINAQLNYSSKDLLSLLLKSSCLHQVSNYLGFKNLLDSKFHYRTWDLIAGASLLKSKDQLMNTNFMRHNFSLTKTLKKMKFGIYEDAESNIWQHNMNDSLSLNSYRYTSLGAFVSSADSLKTQLALNYKYRQDELPFASILKKANLAHDISLNALYESSPKHRLNLVFTYRRLEVCDTLLYRSGAEDNMTGRVEYNLNLLDGVINSTNYYEIGSGLDKKIEYLYLEVAPGQGMYTWTDYNLNGVAELNEFELAHFSDQANYIRILNTSTEYIKTYSNSINQSLNIFPDKKWRNKKGIKKIVSLFSNQFAYFINQKNTSSNIIEFANPFVNSLNNNNLTSYNSSIRNTFSFMRSNPKFNADYIFTLNNNKLLLVIGYDTRSLLSHVLQTSINLNSKLGLYNKIGMSYKSFASDYFSSKNYNIILKYGECQLSFQPNMNNKFILKYLYRLKDNKLGFQVLSSHDIGFDYRYSITKRGILNATFNYIHNKYNSVSSDAIGYEMLEGLTTGFNLTWSLNLQYQLSNALQLNAIYSGRKCGDTKLINTGSIQLRAFF